MPHSLEIGSTLIVGFSASKKEAVFWTGWHFKRGIFHLEHVKENLKYVV